MNTYRTLNGVRFLSTYDKSGFDICALWDYKKLEAPPSDVIFHIFTIEIWERRIVLSGNWKSKRNICDHSFEIDIQIKVLTV